MIIFWMRPRLAAFAGAASIAIVILVVLVAV